MKTIIRETTWFTRNISDFGWGNGYVLIPKDHPLYGKNYDEIDVDVHGGLTFSKLVDAELIKKWELDKEDEGKWCVGFDTCHYSDTLSNWSKEKVQEETERLKKQLLAWRESEEANVNGILPLCSHDYEVKDQEWKICNHCGMIIPNGDNQ